MSTDNKDNPTDTLHGLTVKDLAMLIVAISVSIFFVTIAVIFYVAITHSGSDIKITGSLDLSTLENSFMLFIGAAIAMVSSALGLSQFLKAQG